MNAEVQTLIRSKAAEISVALGLHEPDHSIFKRLENLYLQGVDDATALQKNIHEKMEARINHLANENARLTEVLLDSEVITGTEKQALRTWFGELSDSQILRLQQLNPEVHAAIMRKLCDKPESTENTHV